MSDTIVPVPDGYAAVLNLIKEDVRHSRSRAASAVNRELISLYWRLGKVIIDQQARAGWGRGVVERLSADLRHAFPDMKGFAPNSIWAMRKFYLAWSEAGREIGLLVNELKSLPSLPELPSTLPILAGTGDGVVILSQLVKEVPWGHNRLILDKIKDPSLRLWYLIKSLVHGWSRNVLAMQIDSELHKRQGKAITNFPATLPPPDSDMAIQALKDPYSFDFLGLADNARERDIERSMLEHVQRFLLELGEGFALVGRQYRITIGDKDYFVDLLFYHIRLKCYVAVELKATPFEGSYVGQLNVYLSALDDRLRRDGDNPTIGLLLCRDKSKIEVEYALRGMQQPMAVADYHLTKAIPDDLQDILPSVEELENELQGLTR